MSIYLLKKHEATLRRRYAQKHPLKVHLVLFDEPGPKAEAAGIGEVDHGLGEGECQPIDMGLLL